jgi:allantoinase
VIGSDHSPCVFEEKEKGNNNIWEAWGGISGIQTMLPIIFSEGVIKRKLPLSQLINMMSYKPAKLFGLYPQKGSLMPGSDADIVIFNPNKKWIIEKNGLFYKNKYSPFVGKVITGAVEKTLLRGRVIYEKGEIITNFGIGKFIKRCKAYR